MVRREAERRQRRAEGAVGKEREGEEGGGEKAGRGREGKGTRRQVSPYRLTPHRTPIGLLTPVCAPFREHPN